MTGLEIFNLRVYSEYIDIYRYLWAFYTHGDSRHDSTPHIIKDADEVADLWRMADGEWGMDDVYTVAFP